MKIRILLIASLCLSSLVYSQAQEKKPTKTDVLEKFGFKEYPISIDQATSFFYYHQKPDAHPTKLVLYLQGTAPDPLFSIEKEQNKFGTYRWFPADYKKLSNEYAYVVISKTGIPPIQVTEIDEYTDYHTLNTLDHRVKQADTTINFLLQKVMNNVESVIVYGHSEGAPVAAKLATINKNITHLGFWAGNALPDFYDFAIFTSRAVADGSMSHQEAKKNIMEIFQEFRSIAENKNSTEAESKYDYSNKRWWSYAEPPVYNLLKLDIPIFVQVAGKDNSAPIESTYLIPLEFTRMGKTNLTYNICAECDHAFIANEEDLWSEIFDTFIKWSTVTN